MQNQTELSRVRARIAAILWQFMEMDPERVLADWPFAEVVSDFDSLTRRELVLVVEKAYDIELDPHAFARGFPVNVTEFAHELMRQFPSTLAHSAPLQVSANSATLKRHA